MNDLISRQAAIETVRKAKDKSEAHRMLIQLPSAQRWIPCSERMPEEDGQYLITVKYKHVNDSYEDIYAEHGEFYYGRWDMFCFGHCGEVEDILAWCELPEPWEEEKAEGAATPRGVIFGIGGHPNGQKRIDGGEAFMRKNTRPVHLCTARAVVKPGKKRGGQDA